MPENLALESANAMRKAYRDLKEELELSRLAVAQREDWSQKAMHVLIHLNEYDSCAGCNSTEVIRQLGATMRVTASDWLRAKRQEWLAESRPQISDGNARPDIEGTLAANRVFGNEDDDPDVVAVCEYALGLERALDCLPLAIMRAGGPPYTITLSSGTFDILCKALRDGMLP